MSEKLDVAIVGAGIVGLAHAYHAAKRGLNVAVFDRGARAQGASIRNFGAIWPIGQPAGPLYDRALRSAKHWQELSRAAALPVEPTGSLHLAHHPDEWAVLEEFVAEQTGEHHHVELLSAQQVLELSPVVNDQGLLGGMHSRSEMTATSPLAVARATAHLEAAHDVEFYWRHAVTHVESGRLVAGGKSIDAEQIIVCSGTDMETLYPQRLSQGDLVRCKLQMMSAAPPVGDFELGPVLCGGLTLLHYDAFSGCTTLAAVRERMDAERADARANGVHILVSQHAGGELIIGDSHHYGDDPGPFDSEEVNQIILRELARLVNVQQWDIRRRWHGIYLKCRTGTEWIDQPEEGVTLVTGLGGAGMTLSFGLAEEIVERLFGW